MTYTANFTGWKNLRIIDLLVAYRKAKADCYFENTFPTAINFAEYEQDLLANLQKLLTILQGENNFSGAHELLGECRFLPKKLSIKKKETDVKVDDSHVHFSNPDRAISKIINENDITPEFRIIGDFPVDTHIISALWINMIGHKFDAKLEECCYGARLKRIAGDNLLDGNTEKKFHISSIGSFIPYFEPYQKWRNDGLDTIRDELERDRKVLAVSLDLKSYYHLIDPTAINSSSLCEIANINLTDEEKIFNDALAAFLNAWSKKASSFNNLVCKNESNINGGLAIGLTCSRIISNILLYKWDKLVLEKISPVHYGRYVDDMFIVIRDPGTISNSTDLMNFFQERLGKDVFFQTNEVAQIWIIQQGKEIQKDSKIQLQSDKQKLFILEGQAGLDLLDSIEKDINELSSEHRLLPYPDQLENSTAAKVLSAASNIGESADTLRRADGLTIRRLGWALQLRHVDTLARDLPPNEWRHQRNEFYNFAFNHILRADAIFTYFNYVPRLLGFAIGMNEWEQAEKIVVKAFAAIEILSKIETRENIVIINGDEVNNKDKDIWSYIKSTLALLFIDAITCHYSPEKSILKEPGFYENRFYKSLLGKIKGNIVVDTVLNLNSNVADFEKKAPYVAIADLSKQPYKEIMKSQSAKQLMQVRVNSEEGAIVKLLEASGLIDTGVLKQFIESIRNNRLLAVQNGEKTNESYLPYLFPTRPLTPSEIAELAPECVGLNNGSMSMCSDSPAVIWAKYTQAIRGVWVNPTLLTIEQPGRDQSDGERNFLKIGNNINNKVIVALTNIQTDDNDYASTASDKPNLSQERYRRLVKIVNNVLTIKPKPNYVIFPELSIPLQWVDSISLTLGKAGISLIAGTEYRHFPGDKLYSEAVLVLSDNRLGYPAFVRIRQPKLQPAVGEDKNLISVYGKQWAILEKDTNKQEYKKPVYIHDGFHFGLFICSELQNSKARIDFQGEVDALITLSWNKDLDTFSSLIESSALDVHCYSILVNNRKYGDSRIHAPAKKAHLREIARLRGGDNDYVVTATLDINILREFQSRAKRWTETGDNFKPVPEGFKLHKTRKTRLPK